MEKGWQENFSQVRDRGKHLLETEKWADCKFNVGTGKKLRMFSCHKLILSMASPVLERMFYGSLLPSDTPILIEDIDPDTFHNLLVYIYSDCINIKSMDQACDLFYAAKKYMLPHLLDACTKYMLENIEPANACKVYEFSVFHDEKRLSDESIQIIGDSTVPVINDPSFLDIQIPTLMKILDMDKINVTSELDMFRALERYANQGEARPEEKLISKKSTLSKVRAIQKSTKHTIISTENLRKAVRKIRFLSMTPTEFANVPARSKIFEGKEIEEIFIKLCGTDRNLQLPKGFTTEKRIFAKNCKCAHSYNYRGSCSCS